MGISRFVRSSIGKKTVVSFTGACLGFFLLVHLAGNSTVFLGRSSFLNYAEHLHSLGPLLHLFELGLVFIFLCHLLFALLTYLENLKARPLPYAVNRSSGGRTFASQTMPYSGLIIFIFILVHLKTFHFTDHSITIADIVRHKLQSPSMCIFYIISLLALATHTSHGFWSLFQSFGINHPRYNSLLRQGAIVVSVLGGALYIAIPVATYLLTDFLI